MVSRKDKKRSLRDFIRDDPEDDDEWEEVHKEVWEELERGHPKAAALLAASIVDDCLKFAIQSRFVELSADDKDRLFDGHAPLATFAARTQVGYALGIYGKKTKETLNVIRHVRNGFAHARRRVQFETPEVSRLCSKLDLIGLKVIGNRASLGSLNYDIADPRQRFLAAAHGI
ncbi:MAG: hypothetical protein ACHQRJ_10795 [Alphaproteobacteria bacterium]